MSELIKHECGIALIRLLKPLEYYKEKYGSSLYGLQKLYLMMEKQHNRGQDGAGIVGIKLNPKPGEKYIYRKRTMESSPMEVIFNQIYSEIEKQKRNGNKDENDQIKSHLPFACELYLGHLRYGTFGKNNIASCHPVTRENSWKTKNLVLAGNFNLTNVKELFHTLVDLGQHPKDFNDTVTMLENVGHFLELENQRIFDQLKDKGLSNVQISEKIAELMDIKKILHSSSKKWDGGYVIAGLMGHGDSFVIRDRWGIRPAFYYANDEIAVVASERPVIQTAFNVHFDDVKPIPPGSAIIIRKNNQVSVEQILEPAEKRSCSFERIYFSRGSDASIYQERKMLGRLILPKILEIINYDLENSVISYIPNTAESSFLGMVEAAKEYLNHYKKEEILKRKNELSDDELEKIISKRFRVEKIAVKDAKLRTFITEDHGREDLVGHVYDTTYGIIKRGEDTLVIIDDSIVRGTTLKNSIIRILDKLGPKKIIIVSSSPQIRYPDCYGIDMAKLGDFIAFRAAIELLKERGMETHINQVYDKCKKQIGLPHDQMQNYVKEIYEPFTDDEVSAKISQLATSKEVKAEVVIVYQTVENLHKACPNDLGDWYFTGNYPTPGGVNVVNTAFIDYMEGRTDKRAY